MYSFIDIDGTQGETVLPAEAVCFNGHWLDNEITGFRTLAVEGRELAEREVTISDSKYTDGATLLGSQIPKREITVIYQLIAGSNTEFREAYNKLNSLLKGEEKQLIFNDERDKYFVATKTDNKDGDAGTNRVVGEITFLCADPFKHAVTPKTFTAESVDGILTASIVNEGTVPVPITYNVTMNSDNGYIGIVGATGAMQYGFKAEADGETYTVSENLATLTNLINAADDHGTEAMHPYSREGTAGTLGTITWWGTTGLKLSTIGSDTKLWNGGMKTLTIPADSQGVSGSKNWYCYFKPFVHATLMGQTGVMTLSFLTADGTPICGYNWYKTDMSGNTGVCEIYVYDKDTKSDGTKNDYIKVLKNWTYECNHLQSQNPWFFDWCHCDILKSGSKIRFFYGGKYYWFDVSQIKSMECAKIQFSVKDYKGRTGNKAMGHMGLIGLCFRKDNVEKWRDVPNRYSSGDEVEINGEEGKIYVNGMPKMGDEVTGTTYFKAEPGTNTVEFYNSDWADDITVAATIREAWL